MSPRKVSAPRQRNILYIILLFKRNSSLLSLLTTLRRSLSLSTLSSSQQTASSRRVGVFIEYGRRNYELALGPFFLPKVCTTVTKRRRYWMRRLARPVFFLRFSCASTLGVWPLTFPARASEPCTLPAGRGAGSHYGTYSSDGPLQPLRHKTGGKRTRTSMWARKARQTLTVRQRTNDDSTIFYKHDTLT